MKSSLRGIAAFAITAVLAAAPAFAKDHGEDTYDKHDKRENHMREEAPVRPGAFFTDKHREFAHRYYVEHYGDGRHCPPGLAKKHNGCMPPGQARTWVVGQPIPAGVTLYAVPQPVLVQLPPAPVGYSYSRVGADITLMKGHTVVDVMLNVFN